MHASQLIHTRTISLDMAATQACRTSSRAGLPCRPRAIRCCTKASCGTSVPTPSAEQQPPLFAKLSMPVYSLSTRGESCPATLNLVTYAAPVSIKPRRYAIGLYQGTLSHQNFKETGRGVLQVLRRRHVTLFHTLGKTSGRDVDKTQLILDAGFEMTQHRGLPVLSDAACLIEVQAASDLIPCGDHDVVMCDVVSYTNDPSQALEDASADVLYTAELRQLGLMT